MFNVIMNLIKDMEKNGNSFSTFEKFLQTNLKLIDEDYVNEGYYVSHNNCYSLTKNIFIETGSSFDIFGSSRTGGYYITISNLETNKSFSLFDKDITVFNDGEESTQITILEDETIVEEINKMIENDKDNDFNEKTLSHLLEINSSKVLYFWKNLSLEKRLPFKKDIFSYMYKSAIEKREKIVDYDKISPFGGMDIDYFPISNGECFFDLMKTLFFFFNYKNKEEYYNVLIEYIKEKDEKDAFLKKYEDIMKIKKEIENEVLSIDSFQVYFENEEKEYELSTKISSLRKTLNEKVKLLKVSLEDISKIKELLNKLEDNLTNFEEFLLKINDKSSKFGFSFKTKDKKKKLRIKTNLKTKNILYLEETTQKLMKLFDETNEIRETIIYLENEIDELKKEMENTNVYENKEVVKKMISYFFDMEFPNGQYDETDGFANNIPKCYFKSFIEKIKKY